MTKAPVPYLPLLLLLLLLGVFCLKQTLVEAASTSIPALSIRGSDVPQESRTSFAPTQINAADDTNNNIPTCSAGAVDLLAGILRGMAAEAAQNVTVTRQPAKPEAEQTLGGAQTSSCTAEFLSKIVSKTANTASTSPFNPSAPMQDCSAQGFSTRLEDRGLCPWFYRINEVRDGTRIPPVMMEAQCNCTRSTGCRKTSTQFFTPSCQPITARVPVTRCTRAGDACWSDVENLAVGCGCIYGLIRSMDDGN